MVVTVKKYVEVNVKKNDNIQATYGNFTIIHVNVFMLAINKSVIFVLNWS